MLLDPEACIGCGKCVPYCPMDAIVLHQKDEQTGQKSYSEIDQDEHVKASEFMDTPALSCTAR